MKKLMDWAYIIITMMVIILSSPLSHAYNISEPKTGINYDIAVQNCHHNMSHSSNNIHIKNIQTDVKSKKTCCGDMKNNVHCCNSMNHIMPVKMSDFLFDTLPQQISLHTDLYIENLFIDTLSRPPKFIN